MPTEVQFARVLEELLNERYKRNRAALARAAHVSPSALSQYVRGKATPSLEVLAHLADALGVSIDYLVFGREERALAPEAYLNSHLEVGIRKAETNAANLYDLTARIGAQVVKEIRVTAEALLPKSRDIAGILSDDEVQKIESCSAHTTIVTPSLDTEIKSLTNAENREAAAPSVFTEVVVDNVKRRRTYEYFVPTGSELAHQVDLLRQQVIRRGGLTPASLDTYLKIRQLPRACTPGYVLYAVVISDLQRDAADIYNRVAPFLSAESSPAGRAYIATVEPASSSYEQYGMLDTRNLPHLLSDVEELRRLAAARDKVSREERG